MSGQQQMRQKRQSDTQRDSRDSKTRTRWLVGGVVGLALAALLAVVGLSGDPGASPDPSANAVTESGVDRTTGPTAAVSSGLDGTSAPKGAVDVEMQDFDGNTVSIADLEGRPVVVNFWATWCPSCFAEMPAFETVYQAKGESVQFLGINLSQDVEAALAVVEETGVTYPLARDPQGQVFAAFGGFGMPTTVFLDENGDVVEMYTGELTADELEARIVEYFES
jgi:thiol-disulfide isomerase/thioredoxin